MSIFSQDTRMTSNPPQLDSRRIRTKARQLAALAAKVDDEAAAARLLDRVALLNNIAGKLEGN